MVLPNILQISSKYPLLHKTEDQYVRQLLATSNHGAEPGMS
jgi:hypothetical protein